MVTKVKTMQSLKYNHQWEDIYVRKNFTKLNKLFPKLSSFKDTLD